MNDPIPKLKMIILGGGAVVGEYYLPALSRLGWLESCLVVDASAPALNRLKEKFPSLKTECAPFKTFFEQNGHLDASYDAVVIAVPNALHAEAAAAALDAGLHVLCEKPLTLSVRSCESLAAKSKALRRVLSVGMTRRYLPSIVAANLILKKGLLGNPVSVEIHDGGFFCWPSESGAYFRKENGGVLANMGVHYLDLAERWFGSLTPVDYRDDACGGTEANCRYRLKTGAGISVEISLSYTHELSNHILIRGDRGSLKIRKDVFEGCEWSDESSGMQGLMRPVKPFASGDWLADFHACFVEEFYRFAEAVRDGSPAPVSAEEARTAIGLIEWAYGYRSDEKPPRRTDTDAFFTPETNVCVTGGSGFIGCHLVERLFGAGVRNVTVPLRSYRTPSLGRFPVHAVRVDLLDRSAVRKMLSGHRVVFHLAYGSDGNKKNARRVTVEGTRNVVEAAIAEGVEAVVVMSTTAVMETAGEGAKPDESAAYKRRPNAYESAKIEAERYCLHRAGSSGKTRIVVLNPAYVYGPGGKAFTELPALLARQGAFCWIDGGSKRVNYVFVENLVEAAMSAARTTAAHGHRFVISDNSTTWKRFLEPFVGSAAVKSYSAREFAALHSKSNAGWLRALVKAMFAGHDVREVFNRYPLLASFKTVVSERFAGFHGYFSRLHRREASSGAVQSAPPLPPQWIDELYNSDSLPLRSEKAAAVLGWAPSVKLEEGQRRSVEWLCERGLR